MSEYDNSKRKNLYHYKKKSTSFTVFTDVVITKIHEPNALILIARPNQTTREIPVLPVYYSVMIIVSKIYDAHYLTLTAGPLT
jgi:hypothetical protein